MAKIKYNEDFDSGIFKVTRVDNCKNGCRLSQISFVDDKNNIYKTVKAGRTSIEKLINFHYNVKDSPDIIVHLDEADGVEFTTANSIESKSARGAPDKWTISKVEDPEEELYRIKIVRGGKQGFNRDFLINKHTKDCISEAIYNHLIEHLTKTVLDRAEDKAEDKAIKNASETAPESPKDDLPSIPKPNEESFTTAQINDNNDSVVNIVSETAPESPKEEKVEEIKPKEESLATDQINDNNDSIIGQSIPEVKQEEVKTKTVWDVKEVKDIVFKVEKIDENKLDEVPLGKKNDIAGYFWPSHAAILAKLYGIKVPDKKTGEPDKEAYKEIRKYFGKLFGIAV